MIQAKKIYIIAGEASGDLHGGQLIKEIKKSNPSIDVRGWGGNNMESAGVQLDIRYEKTNFMGFTEVLKNLFTILDLFKITKKSILEFKPDAIILIDYPGFNLRIAKWAHQNLIPVYYYIAPQAWAWKEKRVLILKKYVKKLFVILPFEKLFFSKHGIDTYYFGHPLLETIKQFKFNPEFRKVHKLTNKSIIALLPGSRKQEISKLLPIYLNGIKNECKYQIVIAGLIHHQELYEYHIQKSGIKAQIVYDDTYNLLYQAHLALVTSGTATLETALFGVPELVCYKGSQISYWIAKRLIKVKYISLVNLIADKKIVQELIQDDCTPVAIQSEFRKFQDPQIRKRIKYNLESIQKMLDGHNCYEKVAAEILKDLNQPELNNY
ncbi:MAG: lipid-A-disaccharide synthase [Saprospiraceae bacterium]|nr:lipid-A-disaccharide synthase [Saprospiraceae bacterium]